MFDMAFKPPFDDDKYWPQDEEGEPVRPAFLEHLSESQIESDIVVNMLRAYNIPVFRAYSNNGDFGRIILGFSGTGVDIYVPETMLKEAQNLLSADIEPETENDD
jgi:hypothetical protein